MRKFTTFLAFVFSLFIIISGCGLIADQITKDKSPPKKKSTPRNSILKDRLLEKVGLDPAMFKDAQPLNFSETVSSDLEIPHTKVPGVINFHNYKGFMLSDFFKYMRNNYGVTLAVLNTEIDKLTGQRIFWLRQIHKKVEVFGAYYRAVATPEGEIKKVMGTVYDNIKVEITPKLSNEKALQALYDTYPNINNWKLAPSDTFLLNPIPPNTAVIYPQKLFILPAGLHPLQKNELTYVHRIEGHKTEKKEKVFIGANNLGVIYKANLKKHQQCPSLYQTSSATVKTRYYDSKTIPTVKTCLDKVSKKAKVNYKKLFQLKDIPEPFNFYILRNRSSDPKKYPTYLRVRYHTSHGTGSLINDLANLDNRWQNEYFSKRGYFDAHWSLLRTWDFFFDRYGRTDFSTSKNTLNINLEDLDGTGWYAPTKTISVGVGRNQVSIPKNISFPETDLHVMAHEYTHAINDNMANFIYQGESGALDESIADIFAMVISHHLKIKGKEWLFGYNHEHEEIRNFKDPHLKKDPKYYEGKYWGNTKTKEDEGNVHTNSSVMNHWFYLLSEGGEGKTEKGNPYKVKKLGIMDAADIVYIAVKNYLGPTSQFKQARFATILAAEDIYGKCSDEAKAVGNAWHAVGVGDPYELCKEVWLEFHTIPAQKASVRIYMDQEKEVVVVENEYKTTKVVNRPLERTPSRWVVSNKVDNSILKTYLPVPSLYLAPKSEESVFKKLGIALGKRSPQDSDFYTAEDFDRDFQIPKESYFTDNGIYVNKYRHPTLDNTFFWSAPQIEIPFLAHNWAIKFGMLNPKMSASDNIFRGFLMKMEGPDVNFYVVPHYFDPKINAPLMRDAAVFRHL